MLADSLLPISFWAEAVNTAFYVQNRVLVTKPHNKTPYELLRSRTPSIGFMRPFGCLVTIPNTLDSLGKFKGKVDEGFLVGYSVSSKAFRVFNSITRIVQETLHVSFLKNKPNVAGSDPTWLFDIDSLMRTTNYQPVTLGNQTHPSAGFQDTFDVKKAGEEIDQQYVLFSVWSSGSTNPQNNDGDPAFDGKEHDFDAKKPESEVNVSPSSSAQSRKQDDKTKKKAKGKELKDITYYDDDNDVGAEADFNNLETSITVSPIPTTIVYKDHHVSQIIGDLSSSTQIKSMTRMVKDQGRLSQMFDDDFHTCIFSCFLSQEEPKRVYQALKDPSWIESMQEVLLQFKMQKVWILVDLPDGKRAIGTKWVYKNKKDERGIVIRNKARLVAQGHTQEEGIDYKEVFVPVARIEAIRLFLAYASFMGFMVYQMDVNSAFLYGTIEEEVYVCQPLGFEDPEHPEKVYKVAKALYGLLQAPKAWYETLANYLLENGFQIGKIDKTLFIKKQKRDILLVQIYVDDIIFGATNKDLCKAFEKRMKDKFQMSSMGELTFFLGLQVKQKKDGIFISQDKYVAEILRKFRLSEGKSASTPIDIDKPLLKDPDGENVDVHTYRSMIGSLMYLTSSRPEIMFAVVLSGMESFEKNVTCFIYLKCWLSHLTTNGSQFTMSNPHKNWLVQIQRSLRWRVQKQTALGKDISNPLIVDSLLKTIWLSIHHLLINEVSTIPRQTATVNTPRSDEDRLELIELTVFLLPKDEKVIIGVNAVDLQILDFLWKLYQVCFDAKPKHLRILHQVVLEYCCRQVEGVDCLPNEEIFTELARMGYENPSTKLMFFKAFFSSQWKFLIHTILQCMSAKRTSWNEFSSAMASAVICLSTGMLVDQEVDEEGDANKHIEEATAGDAAHGEVPIINQEPSILSPTPPTAPPQPPQDMPLTSQALEITKLKKRVKILEKRNKVRVLKLRRLQKVRTSQRIDTSNDTVMDDEPNQGRMIDEMDKDDVVVLMDDKEEDKEEDEPAEVQEGMSYDDIRLIFEAKFNSNVAFLLKTKEQLEQEENRSLQKLNETLAEREATRRKLDEEVEDLKRHLEIVPNEDDDVYTEATPLARKVPVLNYKIIELNNKPHYKIIRANETHQLYVSFLTLLRNFDREDLEVLWSLVKERFFTANPKNFFNDFLLTTLRAMFETLDPHAQIWKNKRSVYGQVKVKSWKLLESCGVQIIIFTTT
uniref:Uncharacterized protein n=1 Tax=Tanacetum cinerariifolium TaxID=118510 RepID=A0A6L2N706_TANCI|nr:hypothetical protein [Tanacetum cinerariifolium]